jgi:2-desacetyl-2-hydroxyethyl bacteriochlorophyllide A dehydrogenase
MSLALKAEAVGRVSVSAWEPPSPAAGEVRVAIERCGICGSDLHWFLGRMPLPQVCPGHELSGSVEVLGAGVTGLRIGDRVTIEPLLRCDQCPRCRAGDYHLCKKTEIFSVTRPGGMATHAVLPSYCLHRLPENVDFVLGALAEPLAVAVHALRLGGVREGTPVLVLGAGTIGLMSVAAAKHLGAGPIGITARYPQQRVAAERVGANEVLAPEKPRMSRRPTVAIETVGGVATTVADAVQAIEASGTVVITGLFEEAPRYDPMVAMVKEVRLVASMVYNRSGPESDFETALAILSARGDALRPLVTHTFPLRDAQRAFETAADKKSGAVKVMLAPSA